MVLEGGNNVRWSVQIPKTVFFKKLSVPEIKEKYEKEIEKLKKENKKLKNTIKEIKQHFKN
jgi:cell division protein FtsB